MGAPEPIIGPKVFCGGEGEVEGEGWKMYITLRQFPSVLTSFLLVVPYSCNLASLGGSTGLLLRRESEAIIKG